MPSPTETSNFSRAEAERRPAETGERGLQDRLEFRGPPSASPSVIVAGIGRYKALVLVLGILVAAAGVAYGVKRKPVWTASATVQVGKINPNSPGFSGFVQSETDLAATLSRAITANGVLAIVQRKTGLSPVQSTQQLTATPVPDGAAFSVIATGPSANSAIHLANVAANAMVSYEGAENPVGTADTIYREYQAQAHILEKDRARVRRLKNQSATQSTTGAQLGATGQTSTAAQSASSSALIDAQAAADDAQTRANGLSAAYTQALESSPSGSLLSPLASALTASSDRKHKIEMYGFIGLAGGLLVGGALAILLEQRRVRRNLFL